MNVENQDIKATSIPAILAAKLTRDTIRKALLDELRKHTFPTLPLDVALLLAAEAIATKELADLVGVER
jgi:hypothetical protein